MEFKEGPPVFFEKIREGYSLSDSPCEFLIVEGKPSDPVRIVGILRGPKDVGTRGWEFRPHVGGGVYETQFYSVMRCVIANHIRGNQ